MTRREIKTKAKHTVKKHYMMLVMVSLIAVIFGLQSSSFDNFVRMYSPESDIGQRTGIASETEGKADTRVAVGSTGLIDVLHHIMAGNPEKGKELAEALENEKIKRSENGNRILGRKPGRII